MAAAVGAVAVLGLLVWGAKSTLDSAFGPPDNHVAASDSRVCPRTDGNNLSLADATGHFALVLPVHATQVVFTATVGGLQGESDLSLRFTTTPADLARFLTASHFAPPSRTAGPDTGDWTTYTPGSPELPAQGPCGLDPPVNPRIVYSQDSPGYAMGKSPRSLAVDDTTDPAHPVVWVCGTDL